MNMGFLPALWATDGDLVLVDDAAYAIKALVATGLPHADVLFITDRELASLKLDEVEAWGWDRAVCHRLLKAGISETQLPDERELDSIRSLANRTVTTDVLMSVREGLGSATCGSSFYVNDLGGVKRLLTAYGRIVLKAPWSSSGRGVRYAGEDSSTDIFLWASNIIKKQGGIMVEPLYTCVRDFAMEFSSDGNGGIEYLGLSLFKIEKRNYAGNIIATEDEKLRMLTRYVPAPLIEEIRLRTEKFFSTTFLRRYRGLFGVDMMIVANRDGGPLRINPCIEVNIRRTMGHVANSFKVTPADPLRFMRISHDVNYTLRMVTPDPGYVKVY